MFSRFIFECNQECYCDNKQRYSNRGVKKRLRFGSVCVRLSRPSTPPPPWSHRLLCRSVSSTECLEWNPTPTEYHYLSISCSGNYLNYSNDSQMSPLHWPRNIKLFSSGMWKFWARFGWLWLSLNSSTILQLMPVNPWRHKQRYPLSETPVWQVAFKWQWLLEQLFFKRVGKQLNNWKKQPKRSGHEKKRKGKEKETIDNFSDFLFYAIFHRQLHVKLFLWGAI